MYYAPQVSILYAKCMYLQNYWYASQHMKHFHITSIYQIMLYPSEFIFQLQQEAYVHRQPFYIIVSSPIGI